MQSIKSAFARASGAAPEGFSVFWLLVFAIAILDDEDKRRKDRARNRCTTSPAPKPPSGPPP